MMNQSALPQSAKTRVILQRPAWGAGSVSLRTLLQHRDEILRQAAELEKQGGGLLALTYTEDHEPSILLLLSLLFGRLRRQQKAVQFYRSRLEPDLDPDILSSSYLLIHHLPQCVGLVELLESDRERAPVIIATGIQEEWEQLHMATPVRFYRPFGRAVEAKEVLKSLVQVELEGYHQMGDDAKVYYLVALFDAWGIPLPFALLARALGQDEDVVGDLVEQAYTQQLLFWIELEKPPALLVSTKAPRVAQAMITAIREESPGEAEVLTEYATVIHAVEPNEKEERYTVLNLLQAMLRGSYRWPEIQEKWGIPKTETRRGWLLGLIRTCEDKIESIWQRADAVELLLWGKLFEELREFERSHRVFQEGLHRFPDNPYLLHARAKMLGVWARSNEAKYPEAVKAFQDLTLRFPDNPYAWQSWGVMEAECGRNIGEARRCFDRALQTARRTSESIYTLVAYANLELEQGFYLEADKHLQRAEKLTPQYPHVLHLKGRLAFYRGEYEEAKQYLNELLASNPDNLYALHTLGVMAAKRGHWRQAEEYFSRALGVHPEHIPTLHAFADLKADQGEFEAKEGHHRQAGESFRCAENMFARIQEWEPRNPHILVAFAVLLGKWAVLEKQQGQPGQANDRFRKAEQLLDQVLNQNSRNKYALHALGELKRSQEDAEGAREAFRRLLEVDRENLPALLSLAELALEQNRPDQARAHLNLVAGLVQRRQSSEPYLPRHDLIRICNHWAQLELKLNNGKKAEELLKESLERDPDNAYTLRAYAELLDALGRRDQSRDFRDRAVRLATCSTAREKK